MERWWRGGINAKYVLPPDFSWAVLLFWTFFPIFNPLLYREENKNENKHNKYTLSSVTNSINFALDGSRDELLRMAKFRKGEAEKEGNDQFDFRSQLAKRTVHEFKTGGEGNESEQRVAKESILDFYEIPAVKFLFRTLIHLAACGVYVSLVFSFERQYKLKASCPYQSWDFDDLKWVRNDADMCVDPSVHECCGFVNATVAEEPLPLLSMGNVAEILWVLFQLGMWMDSRYQSLRHRMLGTKDQASAPAPLLRSLAPLPYTAPLHRSHAPFPCTAPLHRP